MIPKDLKKNKVRWMLLAILTLVILIIRSIRNGFFHGKDWIVYLILMVSTWFVYYYRKE